MRTTYVHGQEPEEFLPQAMESEFSLANEANRGATRDVDSFLKESSSGFNEYMRRRLVSQSKSRKQGWSGSKTTRLARYLPTELGTSCDVTFFMS